jgi:hypothetical protein
LLLLHWNLNRGYWKDVLHHLLLLSHNLPYGLRLQRWCEHLLLLLLADDRVETELERLPIILVQSHPLLLFVRNFLEHRGNILLLRHLLLLFIFVLEKLENQGHNFFEHLLLLLTLDQLRE